ncbi:GyrI-like domain-containing protein [Dokdonia sinensis]|uniref:GyrI-like domain-containing protein n=1 Tax=Dokdonia sinensis TaxID=2479847 RepID=UPI001374EE82|nr:GyrI-like domain-containing protein [Dokdonia sinensis]
MKTKLFRDPKVIKREAIHIVGIHSRMSLAENTTQQLWQSFGPRKKEIVHRADAGSYSIQIYDDSFLKEPFLPTTFFEKWAGVAVMSFKKIPQGLEVLQIPEGHWAVFEYQGLPRDFGDLVKYVMTDWLPHSPYELDARPQFEYMDENYKGPMDPLSQEEFWVPLVK